VRKDSAHDALDTRIELSRHDGTVTSPRPGKRVALMSAYETNVVIKVTLNPFVQPRLRFTKRCTD